MGYTFETETKHKNPVMFGQQLGLIRRSTFYWKSEIRLRRQTLLLTEYTDDSAHVKASCKRRQIASLPSTDIVQSHSLGGVHM